MTEPPIERDTLLAGRYRVEAVLGTGGMGRVYRARDDLLGRPVALKVLHGSMAAQAARFEREARTGAALTHPSVVRVLAYGLLDDGRPYLALELVDGENLAAVLRREGAMAAERVLRLVRPLAGALAEAHQRGVIHRDLKPENLLLVHAPGLPEMLRLLDFGIAGLKAAEGEPVTEKLTVTGQVFGTPEYMAPEQAMGRETSPATDVWAFGAVLFAMLTGRQPFEGAHLPEILFRVVNSPPAPLPAGVPAPLAALIEDCLQKDPARRPADGRALLERLEALVPAEPVATSTALPALPPPAAPPASTSSWPSPGARGHRPLLVGGALVAAAVLVTLVLASRDETPAEPEPSGAAAVATPPPTAAPDHEADRQAALAHLAAGRFAEAVATLRALLVAAPALAADPALVAAVMSAYEQKDAVPLAEILAGPMAAAAKPGLLALARSPDPRTRWRAVRTLPTGSPEARTARIEALRQDLRLADCGARRKAMGELAELGDPAAIPDIRAVRSRYNFLENLCLGEADEAAIRKLRKAAP